ncbi:MAG: tRNA (guanosine(46)-N7)-methyltransferase TrmB [Actinobacteria bacterium]|nr:tRNA (guanosine(46)-N7)-methyltransferase TrmB [Actinomycetota bacterium]
MSTRESGQAPDPGVDRTIRSFNARRGRVRSGTAEVLERLWPAWGVDVAEDFTLASLFPDLNAAVINADVVLEIGCGMGETTLAMAAAEPRRPLLAVDVHTPGLGAILRGCESEGLTNVRVVRGDAVALLVDRISVASLSEIRIFFPDPWPKLRHKKRRLIQPDFVRLAASRLRVGGQIHCATDWSEYALQMLDVMSAEPGLRNEFQGFAPRPATRPTTRFEAKGLEKGHSIADLIFVRDA